MSKGHNSGVTGRGNRDGPNGASQKKDLASLRGYMKEKYGIRLASALEKMNFEITRTFAQAAERMMNEFPGLRGQIQSLEGGLRGAGVYAGARLDGAIEMNVTRMSNMDAVARDYALDVQRGFHPAGTDMGNIVVHEMGHQIEAALIRQRFPGSSGNAQRAQSIAWKQSTVARELVSQALDQVEPGWRQSPRKAAGHIQGISGYAGRDASETFAEAISDAYSNGSRAKPLSRALWRLAKQALS